MPVPAEDEAQRRQSDTDDERSDAIPGPAPQDAEQAAVAQEQGADGTGDDQGHDSEAQGAGEEAVHHGLLFRRVFDFGIRRPLG